MFFRKWLFPYKIQVPEPKNSGISGIAITSHNFRVWACLTSIKTNRDLTKRQFCWMRCVRAENGNIQYSPDRVQKFEYEKSKRVLAQITYYTSANGKEVMLRWCPESAPFNLFQGDSVLVNLRV